ncbi:two-component sensor histidine kinase [Chroococcidiopsis sp. CCALA 051]|uniref:sensor histidine kinase n=1 Tax=Chroococcidiopsis sp. CCALA 051 TaxID=869949 RepID=UPI000D0D9114|nr:HAMP domain-containing sensor histidine kinase [Chroococcidiopsis sp. CCALA 051]PSM49605.1 two-component sensor histidine kinase [Chroococcidiopsis sp. CCALA 051]
MFEKIRYRLLLSYLVVIASILGTFAIAVRTVFTRSLTHQLTDKLIALGQGAAANAEYENGQIKIESDFPVQDLIANNQALEWFDTQRRLVERQGKATVTLPLSPKETVQFQTRKNRLIATTLPIIGSDDRKLIGYVRVSQSLEEYDETLSKLDWGLGGGILVALALSGIGGVWLTRQAMQPIEQSFQRLKQFTADASHELRSPLMAVKSNATVALKYSEGMRETDKEKFQAIASATNQMSRLTEDLLFLARNDKIPHRNRDIIDLTELLENLVQLYKPQAEAKQIKLSIQVTKNLKLLGDPDQLRRLFGNLIENAVHYTPNGGIVEIEDRRVSSQWYIDVRDTGVGIAPEQLKHVFDRFWRADRSRSYNSGGSGLGLPIAQAIAQNHGGFITVTSQVEVGSCFAVRLPTSATSVL